MRFGARARLMGLAMAGVTASCGGSDSPAISVAPTPTPVPESPATKLKVTYTPRDSVRIYYGFPVGREAPESLVATITRANGTPAAGVSVNWDSDANGSVAPTAVLTDSAGKAWTRWTLPTTIGLHRLRARSAALADSMLVRTIADVPVRLVLSPDTLRFTRVNQSLAVTATGIDQYGDSVYDAKVYWHADHSDKIVPPGYTAAWKIGLAATSVPKRGWLYAELYYHPKDWDSVFTIFEPIVARTSLTAKASEAQTVGDTATIAVAAAYDADGSRIPDDWRFAHFSSSSPGVATVDSTGVVHALAPGVATISASIADHATQTTLYVYPLASLGPARDIGDAGSGINEFAPSEANAFASDGSRYQALAIVDGPAHESSAIGFFPSGQGRFSRPYGTTLALNVAVPTDQAAYFRIGNSIEVISAAGVLIAHATPPCAGRMAVASSGQAYTGTASCVSAVNADGSNAWTAAVAAGNGLLGSASGLYALDGGQLTALSRTGQVTWTRSGLFSPTSLAAIANSGDILVADTSATRLLSVTAAGATRWSAPIPAGTIQLIVDGDGHAIALAGNDVRSINAADGSVLWTYHSPEIAGNAAVVAGSDGRVYFRRDRWVVVLDGATGLLVGRSRAFTYDPGGGLALGPKLLYVVGTPRVYAFDVPFGPAASWSQLGANYRRTFVLSP